MVCPIISGTIVERRDHVLTTFFSLCALSASTLIRRWPSTKGPFFSERAIRFLSYPSTGTTGTAKVLSSALTRRLLFVDPAQLDPLRASYLAKTSHRTGHAVRLRAEGTY